MLITSNHPSGSAVTLLAGPHIPLPDFGLVVLIGPSGSGKTTFARQHFDSASILNLPGTPDRLGQQNIRTEIPSASLRTIAAKLRARELVILDAPNLCHPHRRTLIGLARSLHAPVTAIGFRGSVQMLENRLANREDGWAARNEIRQQVQMMDRVAKTLRTEGFTASWILDADRAQDATVSFAPLPSDLRDNHGPFDLIGDVHGCHHELTGLLERLGYTGHIAEDPLDEQVFLSFTAPAGRQAVFLGDLTDRGPRSTSVLRLVMNMVARGQALAVAGNHDDKLARTLRNQPVRVGSALQGTLNQLSRESTAFQDQVRTFLTGLPNHLVLADGDLVCVHAGLKEDMHNRSSDAVHAFSLYGDVDGTTGHNGYPNRRDWVASYEGKAMVAYGHTVVPTATMRRNTICLDTGSCFGGHLTAMRWPEGEIVQVKAEVPYAYCASLENPG